jgi:hypothetical protein
MAQAFEWKGQQVGAENFIRKLEKAGQLPSKEELESTQDPRLQHLRHDPQTNGFTVKPFTGEFRHPDPAAKHPAPYSALTPAAHSVVHRDLATKDPEHVVGMPHHARWNEHLEEAGVTPPHSRDSNEFESAQRRFFKTEKFGEDGQPKPAPKSSEQYNPYAKLWEKHEKTERLDSNINLEKLEKLAIQNEKMEKAEKAKDKDQDKGDQGKSATFFNKIFGKTEKTETGDKTPEKTERVPEQ